MKPMQLSGRWVLLTGASSGLGREMALQFARAHRANLVLVARREDRLRELQAQLVGLGVQSEVVVADLAVDGEAERVFAEATRERALYAVVLNAGVTHFGAWDELSWENFRRMLDVNVTSVVRLATLALPYLEQRGEQGGVLIVASMAGLTPLAYQTAYSATKAFLVHFGTGLWHEMRPREVSVTTFAPGGIDTEMVAGKRFNSLRAWLMPVEQCAKAAIDGFVAREDLTVPGLLNRVGSVVSRVLPRRLVIGQVAAQYRRSLEQNR
jgi:short-subunit dehydrogenase